jgi:NAD(P)-dependent dehydrogenase (short-subunit alcohol dehydrogenase family)
MGGRLKGKNAVVTGAGSGVGRAIALALAEEEANIVVCDLGCTTGGKGASRSLASAVVEECRRTGVKAVPHYGDVADFKAAESMIRTCLDSFGSIDILCNIAGIYNTYNIFDIPEEEWNRVVDVHLKGTFNLIRHATPLMMRQRYGRIINCTSTEYASLQPMPSPDYLAKGGILRFTYQTASMEGHANYVAAKGGISSLTHAVAHEMGRYGVTCNAIAPMAWSRLAEDLTTRGVEAGAITPEFRDELMKWYAPKYNPSYFAPFVAYLASDAGANINGCIFLAAPNTLGVFSNPKIVRKVYKDYEKKGRWSFEEIEKLIQQKLLVGYVNPAPVEPDRK